MPVKKKVFLICPSHALKYVKSDTSIIYSGSDVIIKYFSSNGSFQMQFCVLFICSTPVVWSLTEK